MSAALGYMQLCRLCLVKDKVNVPIFGEPNDNRLIFLKISSCLPVKISENDNLPKNICDTCLYKVDLLYQFWNTTVHAEKQLLQWMGDMKSDAKLAEHNVRYQQKVDASSVENTSYFNVKSPVIEQKSEISEPPPAKRSRGRPPRSAKKKAAEVIATVTTNSAAQPGDLNDESSNDRLSLQNDSDDDDIDAAEYLVSREEAELDEEYVDNPTPLEPAFGVRIRKFIGRFPDLTFDGTMVRCMICDVRLLCWNSWHCKHHVQSSRHLRNRHKQFPYWHFVHDLIFMLTVCNIPQHMLDKEAFRLFWEKYVPAWKLPTRKHLRYHLPRVQQVVVNKVKCELQRKKLWITVDETTVAKNNKVGIVLVRVLKPDGPSPPYLIASKRLQETTAVAIEQLVTNALAKFGVDSSQVLMLVTDAVQHMIEAGRLLKVMYPNLVHVTCMLYGLHHVAEEIRRNYPAVDALIASTKQIFVKAATRTQQFRKACPGVPEPPQPILTQCGTWLEAAFYYHRNFGQIKSAILQFDAKESQAIAHSQRLFIEPQMETDLHIIHDNYGVLVAAIQKLEVGSLPLVESLEILDNVQTVLQTLTDTPGILVAQKFNALLKQNPDYMNLRHINQRLIAGSPVDMLQQYFAFANVTSLDAERSFSQYKTLFTPQRKCLTETTIEGLLMLQMYARAIPQPLLVSTPQQ